MTPFVPARFRTWHEPHFSTNCCLPFTRSALSWLPEFVQPETAMAAAASAAGTAARATLVTAWFFLPMSAMNPIRSCGPHATSLRDPGVPTAARAPR